MKTVNRFAVIAALLALGACASRTIDPNRTAFFTKITDTGLKHFEVRIRREAPEEPRIVKAQDIRQQRRQAPNPRRVEGLLKGAAEYHLEQSGYCRTGYWVIGVSPYSNDLKIRGECHELASVEDRDRFPDTISEW